MTNVVDVFLAIRQHYTKYIYVDAVRYKDATNDCTYGKLPHDYRACLSICSQFVLGAYTFGIYGRLNCPRYGEYIVVANAYYGNGLYATWNYYVNRGIYGKRIDDALQPRTPEYATFTDMLLDFIDNIERYDVHKGAIKGEHHALPMT